jgi:hypothetical protein
MFGLGAFVAMIALVVAAFAPAQENPTLPVPPAPITGGTHKQTGTISVQGTKDKSHVLRSFCVTPDGTILAAVGPHVSYGAAAATKSSGGELQILAAEGKLIRSTPVPFSPQAVGVAPNGTIFLAGEGQIARFDKAGALQITSEAPYLTEIMRDTSKLRTQAEEQLKSQRETYTNIVKQQKEQLKKLSAKDPEMLTRAEKSQLKVMESNIKAYESMAAMFEKKSPDDVVKEIKASIVDFRAAAVSEKDLFLVSRQVRGYGFSVWRMTHDLKEPKQIVSDLAGCCGQMDIQCRNGEVFVAENSRKRVNQYSRDGEQLASWGKAGRGGDDGTFGGCCNPMNLCCSIGSDVFAAESDGLIKHYSSEGKFIGLVGVAKVQPGCKSSIIAATPDGQKFFYFDANKLNIIVLTKEESKK